MHAQATQLSDQDIADIAAFFATIENPPETGISAASAREIRAGEEKSMTCQACHGTNGIAQSPQWPNLAGQHGSYLLQALQQYQRSERVDAVMSSMVGALDEQTLEELAAYYAAQPGLYPTGH
jgi:cytochrome c553